MMQFTYEELEELITEVQEKIEQELIIANRVGNLDEVLLKYGISIQEYSYCAPRYAKILVIGESEVSKQNLEAIAKAHGISKDRFEFVLDYHEAKNYPMHTLQYNEKYSDIFVGPMPHKTTGMGDTSSIIAKIKKNQSEYPKLTELISANTLKITKHAFESALLSSNLVLNVLQQYD